jgi:hypothetical protein
MQTLVRYYFSMWQPYYFVTKIIKHSFKASYATIFLTNCDNIATLVVTSSY